MYIMKKIYTKVTAIALTAVMAFTAFQIGGIPTEAGNLSGEDLGDWDYGFEANLLTNGVDYLDDYFDVYQFEKPDTAEKAIAKVGPVKPSDHNPDSWNDSEAYFTTNRYGTSARGGLKPTSVLNVSNITTNTSGYTTLTYKKDTMKEFEAEFEIFPGDTDTITGFTFGAGKPGVFPITLDGNFNNDTGVGIYLTSNGVLYVYGAIDSSKENVQTGLTFSSQWENETLSYPLGQAYSNSVKGARFIDAWYFSGEASTPAEVSASAKTYKIHIEVADGKLTIRETGDYTKGNYITIPLTENYHGGYVSLYANGYQNGAFDSFKIKKNSDADIVWDYNFTNDAWNAPDQSFSSYAIDTAAGTAVEGTLTDQWFWKPGEGTVPGQAWQFYWDCCNFMRPRHLSVKVNEIPTKYTLATLNGESVQNVEAMVEYVISNTGYGMMLAPKGQVADFFNGGISLYVNGNGGIEISGAIDGSDVTWSGTGEPVITGNGNKVTGPAQDGYKQPTYGSDDMSAEERAKQNQTSYILQVKVADGRVTASVNGFEGELSVKLASNYVGGAFSLFSTGCDQGGFIGCNVKKLEDTKPVDVNATAIWGLSDNYVAVALSSDVDAGKLEGTITFDKTKYEYIAELLTEENLRQNMNKTVSVEEETLKFSVTGNKAGKLVTYLFRQITPDALDVNDFGLTVNSAVSTVVLVRGDANDNKKVEVKDLIRYMKGTEVAQNNMIEINDASAMRKTLVGIGTADYVLAGKKALFLGDSIGYGAMDVKPQFGWGGRMEALYGMDSTVAAHSGWMLADHKAAQTNGQYPIVNQFGEVEEVSSYEYVILQGGVNDVWHSTDSCPISIGEVQADKWNDFNTDTVCGALENLIATAKEKAPNAKIAYIINFKCNEVKGAEGVPASFHGIGSMKNYVEAAKSVCKKWNIPCLNLYENETFNTEFNLINHTTDGVHPNSTGYDILARYIGPWMEELK